MTIGEKIKHFRILAGLTQNQLAAASEIHPVSVRKYETNKMIPQLPQIMKLASALHISAFDLLDVDIPLTNFIGEISKIVDSGDIALIYKENGKIIISTKERSLD